MENLRVITFIRIDLYQLMNNSQLDKITVAILTGAYSVFS